MRQLTNRAISVLANLAVFTTAIACSASTEPVTVVAFDAKVQPVLTATSAVIGAPGNETIRVDVVMTNPDAFSRQYTLYQPCELFVQLYDTPARTGTPVYQDGMGPGGCKSTPRIFTLAAHASVKFFSTSNPLVYSQSAPNGQRLPPGRYYATVIVSIIELTPDARALQVGEVVLTAP